MSALTALIVEDNRSMRELLAGALRRIPGISTFEAADGLEALQHMDDACPDIILTDINMPVMDGLTLLKHVRALARLSDVPVLILTTEGCPRERARAIALGASSYLVKPVKAPRVLAEVRFLLKL